VVADAARKPGVDVEFVKWTRRGAGAGAGVRRRAGAASDDLWSRSKMPFKIVCYFAAAAGGVGAGAVRA
jgi:hypothetical protein